MRSPIRSVRGQLRRLLVSLHLRSIRWLHGVEPLPLSYWRTAHALAARVSKSRDPLFPPQKSTRSLASRLRDRSLADLLGETELGVWALDADTLEFISASLERLCPRVLVEFGSGSSTLLLASYAARHEGTRVVSVEQDVAEAEKTRARLGAHGLEKYVDIVVCPIDEEGRLQCLVRALANVLGPHEADWFLIDGPAGPPGCRVHVLPALLKYARPGACWYLDDAFRKGELDALATFDADTGLAVDGVLPLGKGLGVGRRV